MNPIKYNIENEEKANYTRPAINIIISPMACNKYNLNLVSLLLARSASVSETRTYENKNIEHVIFLD